MVLNEITEMETECKYMAFVRSIVRSLSKKSCYRYRSDDRTGKEDGKTQVGR